VIPDLRRAARLVLPLAPLLVAALLPGPALSQRHAAGWGAQAIPLLTHAAPAVHGESRTELYLTQPNVMGHLSLWNGGLRLLGTLNLEGLTLRRGELTPGAWGEGYVDRRHPHTYLHETMAVARLAGGAAAPLELTLAAGRGFAPFGTDDPMVRPLVKYPVNHHHAQVLERIVGIAALRAGPAIVEAGLFSGDEPTSPRHLGTPARFGDSWALRGTLLLRGGAELAASRAYLASPEFAAGSGIDQRKYSVAARYANASDGAVLRYAMAEWARTRNHIGAEPYHAFDTVLGEAAVRGGGADWSLRYERTVRPEEERAGSPFRTRFPHTDVHLLAATRWEILALNATLHGAAAARHRARPFAELAVARPTETLGSLLFDPAEWYGARHLWSASLGVRLEAGALHGRMGRYGAALPPHATGHDAHVH
jgi:hypothetical protein